MNPGRGLMRARVLRVDATPIRNKDGLIARVLYDTRVSDLGAVGQALVDAARKERDR